MTLGLLYRKFWRGFGQIPVLIHQERFAQICAGEIDEGSSGAEQPTRGGTNEILYTRREGL